MSDDKDFVIILVAGMTLVAIVVLATNLCTAQKPNNDLKSVPREDTTTPLPTSLGAVPHFPVPRLCDEKKGEAFNLNIGWLLKTIKD